MPARAGWRETSLRQFATGPASGAWRRGDGRATLLLADGGDAIVGPIEVAVALPAGWRAVTPWPAAASGARFAAVFGSRGSR